ncbi:hypothetical protein JQW92_05525 [Sulfitobacter pseudonitzschiae]|uniref:hypothetical protein n=1 Tax=Pseudosulfitobacter pseudonitzschiae TaxID=1402135 RepID=UPI001D1E0126|nr:hypothetical protein [Pseudosulfitobacter pseudonitzschiae]MBM1831516.1 hypothetical protein [Pseudosulfitobacter pseudonitzschiae]MBM1855775.1 hypothetical protein [Pseudosulfitobacter pseudonitzschiae]MBM1860635.1 hypothetical protein [Pseudosulfitobacter pseudonitzschiae]MBM1879123.1 hypothetical protein [Pseudosulfitobacter pseudonitzschiae]MBM1884853.1 hypothetical protein [Pseudosulfitobacter pseudonitzschiae]
MTDKRKRPKLAPPSIRCGNHITAWLEPEDYRMYYELVMERGTSGAETLRQLVRDAHAATPVADVLLHLTNKDT